ncbi:hypothetical protein NESM_000540200 [Novymonas esmeraldas]|uniref:Transmembrane protein n=1 Tax=Novymonas esmeraldas TaxID=1808958 RepID=A0AAW0ESE6_9TRYP
MCSHGADHLSTCDTPARLLSLDAADTDIGDVLAMEASWEAEEAEGGEWEERPLLDTGDGAGTFFEPPVRVLIVRSVIAAWSLVLLVCCVLAQMVPFCEIKVGHFVHVCSVWQGVRQMDARGAVARDLENVSNLSPLRITFALTTVTSALAFVFAISFVCTRAYHDEQREVEAGQRTDVVAASTSTHSTDARGDASAEKEREAVDWCLGLATFIFLVCAVLCSMAATEQMRRVSESTMSHSSSEGAVVQHFFGRTQLCGAAFLGMLGCALLLLPRATALHILRR